MTCVRRLLVLVLSAWGAAACTRDAPPPAPAPVPASAPAAHAAPMVLTVTGPPPRAPISGDEIAITITVERRTAVDPIDLDVRLPAGVTLLDGALHERLVDAPPTMTVRTLRLRSVALPASDVIVTADLAGVGHGAHAEKAYRFGRAEPVLQPPLPPVGRLGRPNSGRAPLRGE